MSKLNGKVALVTGGNSGLGLAMAKKFAEEGAKIVITGRRAHAVAEAAAAIGDKAIGIVSDAANLADIDALVAQIKTRLGHLDIVVANAGGMSLVPFAEATPEQFDREYDTNVRGTFFTVQRALPLLKDGSSIIVVSSVAHVKGIPAYSIYGSAKAAVRAFARNWAAELQDRKIRVNCLSPGPFVTPLMEKMGVTKDYMEEVLVPTVVAQVPLGRMGDPEELAKAALFLASGDSSFITGIDLFVDGGMGQI